MHLEAELPTSSSTAPAAETGNSVQLYGSSACTRMRNAIQRSSYITLSLLRARVRLNVPSFLVEQNQLQA